MAQYICPWKDEAKKPHRPHFKPVCRELPGRAEDTLNKQTVKWWGECLPFCSVYWCKLSAGFSTSSSPQAYAKFSGKRGFNYNHVMLEDVTSDVCVPFCVCAATSPDRPHLQLQRWVCYCCYQWIRKLLGQQQAVAIGHCLSITTFGVSLSLSNQNAAAVNRSLIISGLCVQSCTTSWYWDKLLRLPKTRDLVQASWTRSTVQKFPT